MNNLSKLIKSGIPVNTLAVLMGVPEAHKSLRLDPTKPCYIIKQPLPKAAINVA